MCFVLFSIKKNWWGELKCLKTLIKGETCSLKIYSWKRIVVKNGSVKIYVCDICLILLVELPTCDIHPKIMF